MKSNIPFKVKKDDDAFNLKRLSSVGIRMWQYRMNKINLWFNENRKEYLWIHCHIFRHSFATRLYSESNIIIKDLCEIMGHKDEQTIDKYIHKKRNKTKLKEKLN